MTNELSTATHTELDSKTLFSLITDGNCAKLTDDQKLMYYRARCEAAGLDYRAQPFQYIAMNGKTVLYALKACTDQLSSKHGIVCEVIDQRTEAGVRTVTVRSRTRDGRQTDEIGCVTVGNLQGDALCNAYMKAVTKAKRRAILSICGLGLLDETELETIPQEAKQEKKPAPRKIEPPKPKAPDAKVIEGEIVGDKPPIEAMTPPDEPTLIIDHGQEESLNPDGSVNAFVRIKDVLMTSGKNTKGPWTKYGVVAIDANGGERILGTFSQTHGKLAEDLKGREAFVRFHPKTLDSGREVYNLELIEAKREAGAA
jgi:hypothetical protein